MSKKYWPTRLLLTLVFAWTRSIAARLRYILRFASSPLHAEHTLGTPSAYEQAPNNHITVYAHYYVAYTFFSFRILY